LPSETMIWQPEFTDKTLSRKPGAVQKTVTEYRRPVPGRESVTRVTDTVSDAIEDTPQYRLKLVNGPDADSDNGKNSENTEDITESVKAPGADIATEVMTPTY
ncbi:hypothetical protein MZD97_23495, partial [Escherichia coli]|nr:hypothetical protein [Escherichia coli]MCK2452579.1 hypothetical protein [Escherichia coli]MCK2471322.1 hypothetical protein [Escherichia coli]